MEDCRAGRESDMRCENSPLPKPPPSPEASLVQLVEHALREHMVEGSISTGSSSLPLTAASSCASPNEPIKTAGSCGYRAPLLQQGSVLWLPHVTCR
jgi:hypothetical protein